MLEKYIIKINGHPIILVNKDYKKAQQLAQVIWESLINTDLYDCCENTEIVTIKEYKVHNSELQAIVAEQIKSMNLLEVKD